VKSTKILSGWSLLGLGALCACGPTGGGGNTVSLEKPPEAKATKQSGMINLNGSWRKASFVDHGSYALVGDHIRVPAGKYFVTGPVDENSLGLLAKSRNGVIDQSSLWPKMRIPYNLQADLDPRAVEAFRQAIQRFNDSTPLLFEPKTASDQKFLNVRHEPSDSCAYANWGYSTNQADNNLVILKNDNCLNDPRIAGLLMHEIAHAIGMEHEWARTDRDKYITINLNNMIDGANNPASEDFPLYKEPNGVTIGSFDFNSITMYGPYIFDLAKEKHKPIITRKESGRPDFVGTYSLSRKDKRAIAILYASQGAPLIAPDKPDGLEDFSMSDFNQNKRIDFTIQNIPDCSFVTVAEPHRIEQKSGSECTLVVSTWGFNSPGYKDITLRAYKEKKETCSDVYSYSRNNRTGKNVGSYKKVCKVEPVGIKSEETFTITWKTPSSKPLQISGGHEAIAANNSSNTFVFKKDFPAQRRLFSFRTLDSDDNDNFYYSLSGADANAFVVMGDMLVSAVPLTKPSYQITVTSEDRQKNSISQVFQLLSSGSQCSTEVSDRIRAEMNSYNSSIVSEVNRIENSLRSLETSFKEKYEPSVKLAQARGALTGLENKLKSLSNIPAFTHPCENDWKVRMFESRGFFDNTPKVQCDKARAFANDPNATARINSKVEEYRKSKSSILTMVSRNDYWYKRLADELEQDVADFRRLWEETLAHFKTSFPNWDAEFNKKNAEISAQNAGIQGSRADVQSQIDQKKAEIATLESSINKNLRTDMDADPEIKAAKVALQEASSKTGDQAIQAVQADKLKAANCTVLAEPVRVPSRPVRLTL